MRIDSVPPDVIVPPPPSGRCSSPPVIATTSSSSAASSLNLNGFSALPNRYRRFTSSSSVSRSVATGRVDEPEQAGAVHIGLARLPGREVVQDGRRGTTLGRQLRARSPGQVQFVHPEGR